MWLQLGPYRINLDQVETYMPVRDEEGPKLNIRYASGNVDQIPVPKDEIEDLVSELDELSGPRLATSGLAIDWSEHDPDV